MSGDSQKRWRPGQAKEERVDLEKEFAKYDTNGDGVISVEEAHAVLEEKLGFTKEKTKQLLKRCDRSGDGHLSFNEFIDFFCRVQQKSSELRAMFLEFDTDCSGAVTMEEARRAFRNMAFNEDEIETLVRAYDADGDGMLQYEEFVKLWGAN